MLGIILFPVALSLLILGLLHVIKSQRYRRMPPGPTGLPILGYLPFTGKHTAETFFNLSKTYGPVVTIDLAVKKTVVLNDYESIQEALVKNANAFSGRPALPLYADDGTIGVGIGTRTYDENWKRLRKFAHASITSYGFDKKSMEEKITEEIEGFMSLLRSKNGDRFNGMTDFEASVANFLCNITMGKRFPYENEVFRKMVDYVTAVFTYGGLAITIPLTEIFPPLRFLPVISNYHSRFRDNLQYVRDVFRKSIKEHQDTFDTNHTRDFIDAFLKEIRRVGKDDPCFNEDQLTYILHDMFIAGTKATAGTLRWVVLLLAHRPDIQENLSKEIIDVIGDSTPAMKHRDDMPYAQAFIHELQRHRTVVQFAVPHTTTSAVNFRNFHIPEGTLILPNVWAVHHDPENFENPDEFNPERFINSESAKFIPNKKVIPFSVGPRSCLGEYLANMELFLFLTNIVQKFEIVSDPKSPLPAIVTGAPVPEKYEVRYISRE